ncbi:flavin reductase family protein [Vibrio ostreicida]|uniref:Flavin reductase n=1 Tax=Vibrio ostreicida TaxID=526588 RepID=A0ABT8BZ47_9VIBR|nr:flavin reductase [Vibrio ostreicida]MDN3611964.1 flavin reductase [Vibrio ostreicida]NPD08857.1 flavin oxidoreductase [Vibrio ostreicida]
MKDKTFSKAQLLALDTRKRAHLVNSLSGFKSANLIGTKSRSGQVNLAIVSSVIHLGSNPPLLGFISRPPQSERHTLENINETGCFTINSVHSEIVSAAHQTSARYARDQSEFDETGLTPYFCEPFFAPFVLESPIKIGLKLREQTQLSCNGTSLIIGEIETLLLPDHVVQPDGYIDMEAMDLVTISGLDSYHVTQRLYRLSYAKTSSELHPLTREGDPSSWAAIKAEID